MSHNVIKTALCRARGHGFGAVIGRSGRPRRPALRMGGPLVAVTLMVACAGCAASHGGRCGDRCGIRSQTCGPQPSASCRNGACAPEAWRAGYRSTHWRPLVTECECVDSSINVPSAPIPMADEEIPLPEPAVIPLQDEPPGAVPRSASVDWEPLLPQTMPVISGRDNTADTVTLHREDSSADHDVRNARSAAHPSLVPQALPASPATVRPGPRPTGILPATFGPTDDPFEAKAPDASASATAVYVPLAWVPTERRELQFKEAP